MVFRKSNILIIIILIVVTGHFNKVSAQQMQCIKLEKDPAIRDLVYKYACDIIFYTPLNGVVKDIIPSSRSVFMRSDTTDLNIIYQMKFHIFKMPDAIDFDAILENGDTLHIKDIDITGGRAFRYVIKPYEDVKYWNLMEETSLYINEGDIEFANQFIKSILVDKRNTKLLNRWVEDLEELSKNSNKIVPPNKEIAYSSFAIGDSLLDIGKYSEGSLWVFRAAIYGDVRSIYRIGELYEFGLSLPLDYSKAFYWFLKGGNFVKEVSYQREDIKLSDQDFKFAMKSKFKIAQYYNYDITKKGLINKNVRDSLVYRINGIDKTTIEEKYCEITESNALAENSIEKQKSFLALGDLYAIACKYSDVKTSNSIKSKKYYEEATKRGSLEAAFKYAFIYYKGMYEEKQDIEKAKLILQPGVKADYIQALALMADISYIEKDPDTREKYLLRAAQLGDARSQYNYGYQIIARGKYRLKNVYLNPKTVERIEKAIPWFILAANNGYSNAQVVLANLYLVFKRDKKHIDDGMALLKLSSEHGDPLATAKLGAFLIDKAKTKEEADEGYKYIEIAAEAGESTSMVAMANRYIFGEKFQEIDYDKAAVWTKLAAKEKSEFAYLFMWYIYDKGIGVKKDREISEKYYKLASKSKDPMVIMMKVKFKSL